MTQVQRFQLVGAFGVFYRWLCECVYQCAQPRQTWVCMRADRGVHVDSLCNGGEGNLLDGSSSAAVGTSPSVHPSLHRSPSNVCPVNLSQTLFLSHLPSISHHPSCLMFLVLHPSLSAWIVNGRSELCSCAAPSHNMDVRFYPTAGGNSIPGDPPNLDFAHCLGYYNFNKVRNGSCFVLFLCLLTTLELKPRVQRINAWNPHCLPEVARSLLPSSVRNFFCCVLVKTMEAQDKCTATVLLFVQPCCTTKLWPEWWCTVLGAVAFMVSCSSTSVEDHCISTLH